MNEKFNKNAKFEQLTNMLSRGEEKSLIVKGPYSTVTIAFHLYFLIKLIIHISETRGDMKFVQPTATRGVCNLSYFPRVIGYGKDVFQNKVIGVLH